ncbi:MAG: hypothetical protein SVX43_08445 [Cyanobacteriota bacterium]|nr:hypothetical protein [Cyanobacteriota bacterium]
MPLAKPRFAPEGDRALSPSSPSLNAIDSFPHLERDAIPAPRFSHPGHAEPE